MDVALWCYTASHIVEWMGWDEYFWMMVGCALVLMEGGPVYIVKRNYGAQAPGSILQDV